MAGLENEGYNPLVVELAKVYVSSGLSADDVARELQGFSESVGMESVENFRNAPIMFEEQKRNDFVRMWENKREIASQAFFLASTIRDEGSVPEGVERFIADEPFYPSPPITWKQPAEPESNIDDAYQTNQDEETINHGQQAQIHKVASVYAALEGKYKPGWFAQDRKEIIRMIAAAKLQGLSGRDFLETFAEGTYAEADINSVAAKLRKEKLAILGGAAALALALSLSGVMRVAGSDNAEAAVDLAAVEEAVTSRPEPTTSVPLTTVAPTTVPPTTTTTIPRPVYSELQIALGKRYTFSLNAEPLADVANSLAAKLGEKWDELTFEKYTGIESGFVGTAHVLDCRDDISVLIRVGDDSLNEIAAANQTSTAELIRFNGGQEPRLLAGGCIQVRQAS